MFVLYHYVISLYQVLKQITIEIYFCKHIHINLYKHMYTKNRLCILYLRHALYYPQVIINEPNIKKPGDNVALPYGSAQLSEENNLEWSVKDLQPGSELSLTLAYTVEHSANDAVTGLPK